MTTPNRLTFLKSVTTPAATLPFAKASLAATEARAPKTTAPNLPTMVEADGRLRFDFTEEQLVLAGGLQPSMLVMKSGDIVLQAQLPEKPAETGRMHYPTGADEHGEQRRDLSGHDDSIGLRAPAGR